MRGSLSPLMLIAGEGLLQNTGLGINTTLQSLISSYTSLGVVSEYASAISAAAARLEPDVPVPYVDYLSDSAYNNILTHTAGTFPSVNNTIPSGSSIGSTTNRFTSQLTAHANDILGNGDLSKFVIQMYTVMAYTVNVGEFIDNTTTINSYLGPTFSDMDNLITGNVSGISQATVEFGTDLINTGLLIDLDKLNTYGTPHALIVKLTSRGLLPYIGNELITAGINPNALVTKINSLDKNEVLPMVIQKKCYEAFKTVTGSKLTTLKQALRINIPTGIETLADLLNTQKIFPLSFRTLTSPYKTGYKAIYLDNVGAVNGLFNNLGKDYYSVMKTGIADANAAMRCSLQQIKNVQNISTDRLGASIQQIETNYGLDLINALDNPLPSSVYSYYTNSFATGSGSNGRYYLSDGIGTPAGITHNDAFRSLTETLDSLISVGALDGLYNGGATGAFTVLKDFLNGVYGIPTPDDGFGTPVYATIPGGYPGAGSYDTYDAGVSAILSAITSEISSISGSYSEEVASANTQFSNSSEQIELEISVLADSGVVFADTPSSQSSIISMVSNLHTYAKQNEYRGPAELLEKMADTTTQSGQALVGALREGRNISKLGAVGVGMDSVPETVTGSTRTADLESATYSVDEVISNISIN